MYTPSKRPVPIAPISASTSAAEKIDVLVRSDFSGGGGRVSGQPQVDHWNLGVGSTPTQKPPKIALVCTIEPITLLQIWDVHNDIAILLVIHDSNNKYIAIDIQPIQCIAISWMADQYKVLQYLQWPIQSIVISTMTNTMYCLLIVNNTLQISVLFPSDFHFLEWE